MIILQTPLSCEKFLVPNQKGQHWSTTFMFQHYSSGHDAIAGSLCTEFPWCSILFLSVPDPSFWLINLDRNKHFKMLFAIIFFANLKFVNHSLLKKFALIVSTDSMYRNSRVLDWYRKRNDKLRANLCNQNFGRKKLGWKLIWSLSSTWSWVLLMLSSRLLEHNNILRIWCDLFLS